VVLSLDVRVLGRIRLSRATDESTSPERQREVIETWAKSNDHEVVGWAEDLDVSGSVDPFDTPALGPWLTESRQHEWDVICAWKLDRLGRDAIRLNKLFGWAIDHRKTVVSATEGIDLSTPVGRLIANVIAFLAEGELEAIRERTRASQKRLRELGRWGGGKPLYGYRANERPDAGWELVPDAHSSVVLLGIIDKAIAGQSLESIARELNEAKELSPVDYMRHRAGKPTRGHYWSRPVITRLLRSKSLLGYATHDGTTVRDAQGFPISKGPGLIPQDVFDRLQAALDARSKKVTNRSAKASPLLGVLVCAVIRHKPDCVGDQSCDCPRCERPMHIRRYKQGDHFLTYYSCIGNRAEPHESNTIRADDAEELVEENFLHQIGDMKAQQRVPIPAEDHQNELDEALRAVDELTALLGTVTSASMRSRLLKTLGALDSRIARLESLPTREAGFEYQETGVTYQESWDTLDVEGRRQLLLRSGITAAVTVPKGTRSLWFDFRVPEDLRERLSA
jgi:site-specific DNA recombinase